MHLSTLVTLQAILKYKSFTAAGDVVGLSASAVSLQVKQLEQYFGRPLFDRSSRQVAATPFALELAAATEDVIGRLDALRLRSPMVAEGNVAIGVITSMQTEFLPAVLRRLRETHPALVVRVPPLNDTGEVLAELKAGRIDAAVIVRPERGGSSRLCWRHLYRQPYVMLTPCDAEPMKPRALLERYAWVAYDSTIEGGRAAARYVRNLAPTARFTVELRSIDAIVAMVALGLGVTVIPQPRRPLIEGYGVREIMLDRSAPSRDIALVCRKDNADDRRIAAVEQAFSACIDAASTKG